MKLDPVVFGDASKFFNFISVTQTLLAKHIIPEVEKAEPILPEMALQAEDVLYELGRMQVLKVAVVG